MDIFFSKLQDSCKIASSSLTSTGLKIVRLQSSYPVILSLTADSNSRSAIGAKLAFHVSQSVVRELKSSNEQYKFRKEVGGVVHYLRQHRCSAQTLEYTRFLNSVELKL